MSWSRQKMLALLAGAGLTGLLLVGGLVLAVAFAIHPLHHSAAAGAGGPRPDAAGGHTGPAGRQGGAQAARDVLAAGPMPTVGAGAFKPSPVSTRDPGAPIVLPPPTAVGPAGVPTGFPATPAGAMAQMAAIDRAALQSGSLAGARAVIAGWALPGGPTPSNWSGVAALAALLNSAGLPGGGDPQLAIAATPLMGQIKGTIGARFVLPCVDFEVDVTLAQTVRAASADCERMVWTPTISKLPATSTTSSPIGSAPTAPFSGRWMVGPGVEPATPPSVWPDTDLAISVGYRDLRQDTSHG